MKTKWTTVFAYTFRHTAGSKGYIALCVIVTLLLLIAIPVIMLAADEPSDGSVTIERAFVVGKDASELPSLAGTPYEGVTAENSESYEQAREMIEKTRSSVMILAEEQSYTVLYAGGMGVDGDQVEELAALLADWSAIGQEDMLPAVTAASLNAPEDAAGEGEGVDLVKEIAGYLVPYLTLMVLYFLILFYGQSVANSVVIEKSSKLMDLFLVSGKPSQMILGKTLAIVAAGLLQALLFLLGAVGGLALGASLVRASNPGSTMGLLLWLDMASGFAAAFKPAVLITASLVLVTGFLLYSSLSAIGGALAGKAEDLSSTNTLFTMALVISFLVCLLGGTGGGRISDAPILGCIPFTAALVMPARLLLGTASVGQGLLSAALSAVCSVLLMVLAGKIYTAMAFYKGKTINPLQMLSSLRRH